MTNSSMQGREKDVVLFSTVRSRRGKSIGFVADERRINVGLTRARWVRGRGWQCCGVHAGGWRGEQGWRGSGEEREGKVEGRGKEGAVRAVGMRLAHRCACRGDEGSRLGVVMLFCAPVMWQHGRQGRDHACRSIQPAAPQVPQPCRWSMSALILPCSTLPTPSSAAGQLEATLPSCLSACLPMLLGTGLP